MQQPDNRPSAADALPDSAHPFERLLAIMARLRDPVRGCPWDVEQTFATIAPYTIEEAYEVADAIQQGNLASLREELGDLLLQVVFHSRMAEEVGVFNIEDVARTIGDKMIARHPHVFADASIADAAAQTLAWETQKAAERKAKALAAGLSASALDGVPIGLPALTRALKLQRRAARSGFDWPTEGAIAQIKKKFDEELAEIETARLGGSRPAVEDECGDLLFVCVNLLRHLDIDPETALRSTNAKFERRFRAVEAKMADEGVTDLTDAGLDRLEAAWQAVKVDERR
jgi:ATP diphosphatase